MELKPGYKQTEVGVIPGDWSTPELGQILKSMQLGGNYKNSEIPTRWPLIKMGNLGRGTIKLDRLDFVDSKQSPAVRDRLCDGDVLFNTRNTLELVGKVAIWKEELPEAYFNSNIMRMDFDEQRVSSSAFMNFILNTAKSITSLRGIATGTTSVAAIYGRDLAKIVIPLPTKAEQVEIAEALSDADALIESLDQLIAKKRQIKQGAMQELLTGKRRLPGFSGEWEVVQAGDIGYFKGGSGFPTRFQGGKSGEYPFYKVSDMNIEGNEIFMKNANNYIDDGLRRQVGATSFPANSIVFAKVGAAVFLERKKILSQASCLDNNMAALILDDTRADFRFIHFVLLNKNLGNLVSATALPSLSNSVLATIELVLPPRAEQTAIATILSDMDTELAALESRLAKARQIKQGMMQELLTGRIRLL